MAGIARKCGCSLFQIGHPQVICGLSFAQIRSMKQVVPSLKAHMELLSVYHLEDTLSCTEQQRGR